ncbi:transposase [Dentiradicibacter hellwigii]|uniref:Transposase n=1 Tax=Dentiradicibacter hellwigii TaxID=3149053 RepID=A0ABV4UDX6_9RHOO
MDKIGVKNRCIPYAARLYKSSKPLNTKNAFFCGSKQVRKDGAQSGKQRYRCVSCHKRFSGGKKLNLNTFWQRYSEGKQSAAQLAGHYGCSLKTIRRHLAKAATQADCVLPQAPVNLIMDTTYFGRKWGVMVLYDARSKRALTVVAVERETNALYTQEVAALQEKRGGDTKHYLRWQKRLAGLLPGYTRANVKVSPNQNRRAPPDQKA